MMDDLASADFDVADAATEALAAPYEPLLTDYIVARGEAIDAQINPIRLIQRDQDGFVEPVSVFMIYIKFDALGQLIVRQLKYDDFPDDQLTLQQAEAVLLGEGRAALPNGAHVVGSNFSNMRWRRPYYMTFVIDNPGWKFYWGEADSHEAIRFLERKDSPGDFQIYQEENYTFFDAEPSIALGSGAAFRCINYHRDRNGPILGAGQDKYCFEIYLQAPFKDPADPGAATHITVLIDPDGQNQGPRT